MRRYTHHAFHSDYKLNRAISEANIFWSLTARTKYREHTPRPQPHSSWVGRWILAGYT